MINDRVGGGRVFHGSIDKSMMQEKLALPCPNKAYSPKRYCSWSFTGQIVQTLGGFTTTNLRRI